MVEMEIDLDPDRQAVNADPNPDPAKWFSSYF
jgi:hypothetical protein